MLTCVVAKSCSFTIILSMQRHAYLLKDRIFFVTCTVFVCQDPYFPFLLHLCSRLCRLTSNLKNHLWNGSPLGLWCLERIPTRMRVVWRFEEPLAKWFAARPFGVWNGYLHAWEWYEDLKNHLRNASPLGLWCLEWIPIRMRVIWRLEEPFAKWFTARPLVQRADTYTHESGMKTWRATCKMVHR